MALKGNLRDFSVTQLLNLINLADKSGALIVQGTNGAITLFFNSGKLAYAQAGSEENGLVNILYKANRISSSQHQAIEARAGNISDKELGLMLINANYISRQEIIVILQSHFISIIEQLFTWVDGIFQFENNAYPPNDKVTVRVNLENIIIEGSRRTRELEYLQDEIPSLDMALKFADRPGKNIQKVNLSVDEWRVVSYINPKNSMRQIARATKLTDMEFRKIAYSLIQAGLVQIVRPEGAPRYTSTPSRISISTTTSKTEQKSLVNRIISRIRSL